MDLTGRVLLRRAHSLTYSIYCHERNRCDRLLALALAMWIQASGRLGLKCQTHERLCSSLCYFRRVHRAKLHTVYLQSTILNACTLHLDMTQLIILLHFLRLNGPTVAGFAR